MVTDGKILAAWGAASGAMFAAASAADASTNTLILVGLITGTGTAIVGVYSAFRAAKHRADVVDQALVQRQLAEAMVQNKNLKDENEALRFQVKEWSDLYRQIMGLKAGGSGLGKATTEAGTS